MEDSSWGSSMARGADVINSAFGPKKEAPGPKPRVQNLPLMFEVSGGDMAVPEQFVLPIPPKNLQWEWNLRNNITHTKAGAFEDKLGIGLPTCSIRGSFGYMGTLPAGSKAKSLSAVKASAYELFKEMEALFLDFYERFGTNGMDGEPVANPVDPANAPVLNFYNFSDKQFWVVQINKFQMLRNTENRMQYLYDIQMTGLRKVTAPMSEDELLAMLQDLSDVDTVANKMTFAKGALALYAATSNAMTTVVNRISEMQNDLTRIATSVKAFRTGVTSLIQAPFNLVTTAITTIDSIVDTVVSFQDVPHEAIDAIRETKRALLKLVGKEESFSSSTTTSSISAAAGSATEILTMPLPSNAASMYQPAPPEETIFSAGAESVQTKAVIQSTIADNDTIYSLAAKNGVDWKQLAALNNLEYPFIARTPIERFTPALETGRLSIAIEADAVTIVVSGIAPLAGDILVFSTPGAVDVRSATVYSAEGNTVELEEALGLAFGDDVIITRHHGELSVLSPGKAILIPDSQNVAATITGGANLAERIYGIDEAIDDEGNQATDNSGDILTAAGIANIEMQLAHRLTTRRGELAALGHLGYGTLVPAFIGKIGKPAIYERLMLEADLGIQADPRVKRVEQSTLLVDGTAIYYEADVLLRGQSSSTKMKLPLAA